MIVNIISKYVYDEGNEELFETGEKEYTLVNGYYTCDGLKFKIEDKRIIVKSTLELNYTKVYDKEKETKCIMTLGNNEFASIVKTDNLEISKNYCNIIATEYTENGDKLLSVEINIYLKGEK